MTTRREFIAILCAAVVVKPALSREEEQQRPRAFYDHSAPGAKASHGPWCASLPCVSLGSQAGDWQ